MNLIAIQSLFAIAIANAVIYPGPTGIWILAIVTAYLVFTTHHEAKSRVVPPAPLAGLEQVEKDISRLTGDNAALRIELERLRDEQAKIHAVAEDAKKLMSQANLGMGFRPRSKME